MDLHGVHGHGYTFMVDGNGGEEQLVIVTTFGQSGHVGFEILQTSCDGGHFEGKGVDVMDRAPYGVITEKQFFGRLKDILGRWGLSEKDVKTVVQAFKTHNSIE